MSTAELMLAMASASAMICSPGPSFTWMLAKEGLLRISASISVLVSSLELLVVYAFLHFGPIDLDRFILPPGQACHLALDGGDSFLGVAGGC